MSDYSPSDTKSNKEIQENLFCSYQHESVNLKRLSGNAVAQLRISTRGFKVLNLKFPSIKEFH